MSPIQPSPQAISESTAERPRIPSPYPIQHTVSGHSEQEVIHPLHNQVPPVVLWSKTVRTYHDYLATEAQYVPIDACWNSNPLPPVRARTTEAACNFHALTSLHTLDPQASPAGPHNRLPTNLKDVAMNGGYHATGYSGANRASISSSDLPLGGRGLAAAMQNLSTTDNGRQSYDRYHAQHITRYMLVGPSTVVKDKAFLIENRVTKTIVVRTAEQARQNMFKPPPFLPKDGIEHVILDIYDKDEIDKNGIIIQKAGFIGAFTKFREEVNGELIRVYKDERGDEEQWNDHELAQDAEIHYYEPVGATRAKIDPETGEVMYEELPDGLDDSDWDSFGDSYHSLPSEDNMENIGDVIAKEQLEHDKKLEQSAEGSALTDAPADTGAMEVDEQDSAAATTGCPASIKQETRENTLSPVSASAVLPCLGTAASPPNSRPTLERIPELDGYIRDIAASESEDSNGPAVGRSVETLAHHETSSFDFFQPWTDSVSRAKIFTYCEDGNSKSASMVASWIIWAYEVTADVATSFVMSQRCSVTLTKEQEHALKTWEELCTAERQSVEQKMADGTWPHKSGSASLKFWWKFSPNVRSSAGARAAEEDTIPTDVEEALENNPRLAAMRDDYDRARQRLHSDLRAIEAYLEERLRLMHEVEARQKTQSGQNLALAMQDRIGDEHRNALRETMRALEGNRGRTKETQERAKGRSCQILRLSQSLTSMRNFPGLPQDAQVLMAGPLPVMPIPRTRRSVAAVLSGRQVSPDAMLRARTASPEKRGREEEGEGDEGRYQGRERTSPFRDVASPSRNYPPRRL